MSKTVRLDEDTHAILADLKGEEETFDEVIRRLLAERRERIREGAGYWDDDDAAVARTRHERMRESVGN